MLNWLEVIVKPKNFGKLKKNGKRKEWYFGRRELWGKYQKAFVIWVRSNLPPPWYCLVDWLGAVQHSDVICHNTDSQHIHPSSRYSTEGWKWREWHKVLHRFTGCISSHQEKTISNVLLIRNHPNLQRNGILKLCYVVWVSWPKTVSEGTNASAMSILSRDGKDADERDAALGLAPDCGWGIGSVKI